MYLTYPAIFYEDKIDGGYTVIVPDLDGCITEGNTLEEAIEMGVDAASGWILTELEDGGKPPKASKREDIHLEKDAFINDLLLDMDRYISEFGNKTVNKSISIPSYVNIYAKKHNLDFSKILSKYIDQLILGN